MNIAPYIVGIDGGGTKSRMVIADLHGQFIGETSAGAVNLCAADETIVEENLRRLFKQANDLIITHEGCTPEIKAVALGTAGVGLHGASERLSHMLTEITGGAHVAVTGDMIPPLYAYAPNGNAQIIIAGTGSICYGKTSAGQTARCSGWGHLIGDEGGAYWITCRALDAVMRAYDGRGEDTVLTTLLTNYFQCASPTSLISHLYGTPFDKSAIAGAAVCVAEAANSGDKAATHILDEAAARLFEMVQAVASKLGVPDAVLFGGGVLVHNAHVREILQTLIGNTFPTAEIVLMDGMAGRSRERDAAWGAVLMAMALLR